MFFLFTRNRSIKRSVISTDSPSFHTENIRRFFSLTPMTPGGEASRGHQWVVQYVAGKMPKANFWRWYFQTHFSPGNLHLEERKAMQLSWIPPLKCSKGSCLEPPFWGSQCTGNQNKEWKSRRTLYVLLMDKILHHQSWWLSHYL